MTTRTPLRSRLRLAALVAIPALAVATGVVLQLPAQAQAEAVVTPVGADALPATAAVEVAGLVLNDAGSQVNWVAAGATYRASVAVRASAPPVRGEIEVLETAGSASKTYTSEFTLSGTGWTTVTMDVVTTLNASQLSVSVHVFNGADLEVQSSGLTLIKAAPGPVCKGPIPSGTAMGTSMSYDGREPSVVMNELDRQFGTLEAVRLFDPLLPASWSSARAAATAGRTVIISFRPMPQDVLSGKYDAELKAFFTQAPSNQTIYWSYIHEPEPLIDAGTFTSAQYKAAWQRIAGFATAACKPNMHATLILTGWTADPGSGRSVSTYFPGNDIIDVIGWDPYNGVHDAARDYYISAADLLGNAKARSQEMGEPWAMAETGSRLVPGDTGAGRAAWLTSVGTYLRNNGAVYGTYFNSDRDANWVLTDAASQQAWAAQIDLG